MTTRMNVILPNGARFALRPDMEATYANAEASVRTYWRWVCFNADGTIAARGSDLSTTNWHSYKSAKVTRSAERASCALMSFAEAYYDDVTSAQPREEMSATDIALGAWYGANEDEITTWRYANDPELQES